MKNTLNFKNTNLHRMVLLLMFCLTTLGCSNDFLEEPQNTAGITEDVVFSSRQVTESFIAGIYANYKGQYAATDTGGMYAMYFARVIKGNDLIQSVNWFMFDYANDNREPNYRRTNFTWNYNYQIVNFANILIKGVSESELSESEKNEFIAIGKAIRAFHHFQLVLEFAPNYNNDRSIVRIPYYTDRVDLTTVEGKAPAPLSEIYNQIIQDLTEAIPNIPETRIGKSYINRAVANGMLARVLSVTQDDWQGMSNAARAAYGGDASSAVASSSWGNGFNNMQDQEWLWGLFQNGSSETNYYYSTAAQMDHNVLSYFATYANPVFVNQFSNTDVRKVFTQNFYGAAATAASPWREYVTNKFAFSFDADYPLMRKSEMVLFDAEAQYQLGNTAGAKSLLFALQSARNPQAVMSANIGQQLLDEILLERRKELYGEIGTEWFDAKRYNRAITRDPVHRVPVTIPANDPRFYLKIPQAEIDANPNYTDAINLE